VVVDVVLVVVGGGEGRGKEGKRGAPAHKSRAHIMSKIACEVTTVPLSNLRCDIDPQHRPSTQRNAVDATFVWQH
jgi:hypothetical protein